MSIYKQLIPQTQPVQNVASFSCGHSCVVAVDDWGELFSLGNNEFGQLALEGELHSKAFKKCSSQSIGKVKTVNCLQDTTFILTQENEIYICGRIS